jgi:hypothetical protein
MELGAICGGPPRFRCASRGSRRLGFDPKEPRSAADMRRSVCGGDGQLHVRANPSFIPQLQPRSDSLGPLPNPQQPPNGRRARLPAAEVVRVGPFGPFLLRVAENTPESGKDSFHD